MTGRRKSMVGTVVSNKMDKTVVVLVERLGRHPLYKKVVKTRKKFKAHDADNACQIGDVVRLVESRPLSKEKRWAVEDILRTEAERAEQ
jgi:small subunit ribosomal protein S17